MRPQMTGALHRELENVAWSLTYRLGDLCQHSEEWSHHGSLADYLFAEYGLTPEQVEWWLVRAEHTAPRHCAWIRSVLTGSDDV
jgi:hypothetical protein